MKAVHFGAGNIGRGFIAWLLAKSGYEVVFVDVNEKIVNDINDKRSYSVILAEQAQRSDVVSHVCALLGTDRAAVVDQIVEADLLTTAIGVNALKHIAATIADGLRQRMKANKPLIPVIACENAIGASQALQQLVHAELAEDELGKLDRYAVFPNAAVDRIVPVQRQDGLNVVVEPYFEWIVDGSGLPPDIRPDIFGLRYADALDPYISRKLFTVNTGHCSAAYLGYLRGYSNIHDVMKDRELHEKVRLVMKETGNYLIHAYRFDRQEHEAYIEQILSRFANPYLQDDVLRIGRSPIRKLSPGDRLVKPAMLAYEQGLSVHHLLDVIAAALRFDNPNDEEAVSLQAAIRRQGIGEVVEQYLGIPTQHELHRIVIQRYYDLEGSA